MAVDELGFKVTRTRVGDIHVSEELKRTGEFGGEPSGAWIFPEVSLCPDGIYAAARLVEIVEKEGEFSGLLEAIPEYPVKRGAFQCGDKNKAMVEITENLKGLGNI